MILFSKNIYFKMKYFGYQDEIHLKDQKHNIVPWPLLQT